MQGADYRYGGYSDPYTGKPYSSGRMPEDPYNRSVKPDPYSRSVSSDQPSRMDPYARAPKPDPYVRDDPSSRRPDPYSSQQRNADANDRMQSKDQYDRDDYPVRAPQKPPAARDDPYSRQPRSDPYDLVRQQSLPDKRYRNDGYPVDGSPLPFASSSDSRRRAVGDNIQRPGQLQSYQRLEPMANIRGPSVSHELDHLATFTVNRKQGLFRPDDGIRRLKDMEATSGIWAMRIQLKIDRQELVVMEKAENKELECFPISQVKDPTCMTLDSNDLYNNIVIFTVNRTPAEMHLFQCVGVNGQEVVDDIIAATSGKFPRQQPVPKVVPGPRAPSPQSLDDDRSMGSSLDDLTRPSIGGSYDDALMARNPWNKPFQPTSNSSQYNNNNSGPAGFGDVPKTNKQSFDNDVTLLNHCLDDLEGFVSSLQVAASAQQDLNRRLSMSGGQDPAVDMLRAQAQAPSLPQFVDTLQKFKVAFNLLSKLQSILKDPDAVELLHMLFGLLKVVTSACQDNRGVPTVAQKVESPMLAGDTCLFLESNLRPAEMQLLQLLGPAWTTPGHLWGRDVPPYVPRFKDGWQHPSFAMNNTAGMALPNVGRLSVQDRGTTYGNSANANSLGPNMAPSPFGGQFDSQPQGPWQSGLQFPQNGYSAPGQGPTPGQFQTNQPIPAQGFQQAPGAGFSQEPTRDIQPSSSSSALSSMKGNFPGTAENTSMSDVSAINPSQLRFLNDLKARGAKICTVLQGRTGTNPKELTVNAGDVVELLDDSKKWWKVQNLLDQSGFVPSTILRPYNG